MTASIVGDVGSHKREILVHGHANVEHWGGRKSSFLGKVTQTIGSISGSAQDQCSQPGGPW